MTKRKEFVEGTKKILGKKIEPRLKNQNGTTLLVVDMQAGFINEHNKEYVPAVIELIESNLFDNYIYTKYINTANSPFSKILGWTDLQDSASQQLVVPYLNNSEIIVQKHTYGISDDRVKKFKEDKVKEIYICGTDIDACVYAIGISLFDNNVKPIFITDACMTSSETDDLRDWSLKIIERQFGNACMITSDELKEKLKRKKKS
ncbi:MAG: isochorismatase family protein [Spirochaetales bacterium]